MEKSTFLILGGDKRSIYTAEQLCAKGLYVQIFGFDTSVDFSESIARMDSLESALNGSDFVILPLPCSNNSVINTPLYDKKITINALVDNMTSKQIFFGGKIEPWLKTLLDTKAISYYDYAEQEEFSVLNAIATAEGAIEVAMKESSETINGSSCLVLGFGRIAKVLCHLLKSLGADVTATARKNHDLAWIRAFGYRPIHTEEIKTKAKEAQLIFNTIPHQILGRETLSTLRKDSIIIDLASVPGGVDFPCAKRLGIKAIHALSLPGKVAPKTAGEIIGDTILNILNASEVTT